MNMHDMQRIVVKVRLGGHDIEQRHGIQPTATGNHQSLYARMQVRIQELR